MKQELEQKLYEQYPELFKQRELGYHSPMAFGIAVGDGWHDIINCLCTSIYQYVYMKRRDDPEYKFPEFAQIKEKFGDLRIYLDRSNDAVYAMVSMAEMLSSRTCEDCGNKGEKTDTSWVRTLCKSCQGNRYDSK